MIDTGAIRSKVLELAIRGKLSEQLLEDGTAEELYILTQEKKQKLIKEGKIKDEKLLADITEDEIPFDIPSNWKWVRLGDCVSILGDGLHGTPKYSTTGEYYFINGNNLRDGKIEIKSDTKRVDYTEYEKHKKTLNDSTVLVSINGTIGNVAFYAEEKVILGKSACYFNLLDKAWKKYIYWIIKTDYFLKYAATKATGVTIKNVSLAAMKLFLIPLPPLKEQERIIKKIEDIFITLDWIDCHQNSYISDSRILKTKIIDAGIRGKLTEQCPEDGTAEELYADIQEEKVTLIKKGKIKKEKALLDISDEEIPFAIPENWKWVRLGDISNRIWAGGDKPSVFSKFATEELNIPVVANGVTDDGILGYTGIAKAPAETITVAGRGTIGYCVYRDYEYCPIVRLIVIEPTKGVEPRYLKIVMQAMQEGSVGSSIPQLTVPMIKPKLIPLPPYEEQKRIVNRLEALFQSM